MASRPQSVKIGHIGTAYLHALTDDFSIAQHTLKDVIDVNHGYSLDDAARGLIAAILFEEVELAHKYVSFIRTCCMHKPEPFNFYDQHKKPVVKRSYSPDALGETYWALSIAEDSNIEFKGLFEIKSHIAPFITKSHDLRPLAYGALTGDDYMVQRFEQEFEKAWKAHSTHWWPWPEHTLTYANAIIPLAALIANKRDPRGWEMLKFLNSTCSHNGIPCPIGNEGWFSHGEPKALYNQQPIDPAYLAIANAYAFSLKNDVRYKKEIERQMGWFWGWNTAGIPLIDTKKERVFDGIHADGLSENAGSECIVCYLIAQKLYEEGIDSESASSIQLIFRPRTIPVSED